MVMERQVPLLHRTGLHLRAAGKFAQVAGRFGADIRVGVHGRLVNGKSALDILTLGAAPGVDLIIRAEGPDAEAALMELEALVKGNFDEE